MLNFTFEQSLALNKTLKGFLISTFGALLAGFVVLSPEIGQWIQTEGVDKIDYFLASFTTWGAFASGVINAGHQILKLLKSWYADA